MQVFSTVDVAAAAKLDAWNKLCSSLYNPLDIEPMDREAFAGRMEILYDDLFRVTRFTSAPVHMNRTRARTRHATGTSLTVFLRLTGEAQFMLSDRDVTTRPGDFMLLDAHTPFGCRAEQGTSALAIGLPDHLLSAHLPNVGRVVGRVMDGGADLNACIAATMRTIASQAAAGRAPSLNLARGLLELISASCAEVEAQAEPVSPSVQRWRRRIAAYVGTHLRDPELTPARIATALNISQRYLRLLQSEDGETIAQQILRLRLEEGARCLLNPGWNAISITELAHHWGFEDSGYFARRFKERFGVTPSAYRAGAIARC
ncbi:MULTISPECIES: helix-turn-helix domain-containing protein [unclassified Beijerinckia]|uniref:helix-turn-helix domain-containing protein n=1 Tax=unclassified Beijerinckia TaxID=2638183 RepID=UPI00089C6691|nr:MULTISPECIES: helix-turn-helix domain-containing protein [unclassified Beijerinckia]MDH7794777.1 AraC family transcriptional activator of tynA and feaB [Beijerinckia sp. GAS462]SEB74804.1 AraC-type DNA-binding protein [Beijerinckia sp. 28-YEA-48]